MARRPPGSRRRLPRERRRDRRARPARGSPLARRGAVRGAAGHGGRGSVRAAGRCGPRDRHAGAAGACARRQWSREDAHGRAPCRGRAPQRGTLDHRGRVVLGRRAGGRSVLARLLPLPAHERADGARALQRGARARRAFRPALRRAQGEHPLVALALLAAPAGLRGCAGRRRAGARAFARCRRPAHHRRRLLPGLAHRRPRGPLGVGAQLRRARARGLSGSSPTASMSAS